MQFRKNIRLASLCRHIRSNSNRARYTWRAMAISAFSVLATTLSISASAVSVEQSQSASKTHSCYLKGLSDRLQCGKIAVPENPNKPDGRKIDIHFAIIPAIKNSFPNEAILGIAGGPGQSAMDSAAGFERDLSKAREQRDILLIDQRGTGRSNILSCDWETEISLLGFNDENQDMVAETKKCLEKYTNKADITQYGSLTALNDFEAVRQYLGYQKLHLYGVSYGTRMAQLYMRQYPQSLATVTLDGVVPMQQSVTAIFQSIDRAIALMLKDCQQSSMCHQQFPNLKQEFEQVSQQLANKPFDGMINDPSTGDQTRLLMTQAKYMGAIRLALYSTNTRSLLPYAIHQASKGDYRSLSTLYALTTSGVDLATGMHNSVVCGEDWPRIPAKLRQQAQHSYFGKNMFKSFDETCQIWKIPTADASFAKPIESDIPTLLLSGEIDPATPPAWGDMAMKKLSNAKHFVAPYATHGVARQSCGKNLMAKLIETSSLNELDGKCLDKDVSRNFYLNASSVETLTSSIATKGKE
ncbi:MAG: alpha/beta hydrolase [Parashewanella sp.]